MYVYAQSKLLREREREKGIKEGPFGKKAAKGISIKLRVERRDM